MYHYQTSNGIILTAGYFDYPKSVPLEPSAVFSEAKSELLATIPDARLLSSRAAKMPGAPSMDVVGSAREERLRGRFVLDDNVLYQLTFAGPVNLEAEYGAFVSSFRPK